MVCILIISALIPFLANAFFASSDSHTKWPVEKMVTSVPSSKCNALPISKVWFSGVKFGTFGLRNVSKQGLCVQQWQWLLLSSG